MDDYEDNLEEATRNIPISKGGINSSHKHNLAKS